MSRSERPLEAVPRSVMLLFLCALTAQGLWHWSRPTPQAEPGALGAPPSGTAVQVAALGEPATLSRLLVLWLQGFDSQPGMSVPLRRLDYARVEAWLEASLRLDPANPYPLLLATRVYGEVNDEGRQRRMLAFVYAAFQKDPAQRWPWLAHAAHIAKHDLKDLHLAREYARAIRLGATGPDVPGWARDMESFILEDMGELEAARLVIGGLLATGRITDPRELGLLEARLKALENRVGRH